MGKLYVSMYHYTRDLQHSRYPGIKGMDISLFRQQIEYMKSHFNIVTMEQVIDAYNGNKELPENALLLTFDDGYVDNYTYALPILEEFDLQGTFFIPGKTFATHQLLDVNKIHYILASGSVGDMVQDVKSFMDDYRGGEYDYADTDELYEKYAVANRFDSGDTIFVKRMLQTVLPEKLRSIISSELFRKYVGMDEETLAYELYMTPEQVMTLKRHGMFIGIHGYDHYWLANLEPEEMRQDIRMALDTLGDYIDKNNWVIGYPYGNYNEEVVDFLKEKGCVLGFTTEVKVADIGKDTQYKIPRLDCNDFPPKSENYKSVN